MLSFPCSQENCCPRFVVLGSGGFVGNAVSKSLEAKNLNVLRLGRKDIDLRDENAGDTLASLLRDDDRVIAVSAIAPVKSLSMFSENIKIIQSLVSALSQQSIGHLLNIGSDAVFADSSEPLNESSSRGPVGLHGVMHLLREIALNELNVPQATLRPTLIYGAADPHNGYGPNQFIRLANSGKPIVLFGEGEELRDHVYIGDVAELAARISICRAEGSLNAATGMVHSFKDIAEHVVNLSPEKVNIETKQRNGPMPHDGYRSFEISATRSAFPDFVYTELIDGLTLVQKSISIGS